ncbi:hypothetical protein [Halarcobacter sp.]|uniref:hypothetical protein n=1 Tax=Halarcobacter sp. TaxID=2321133 RepID=UPI002AA8B9F4|nr:hypothetical protein [Halarcobacter sp.]
MNINDVFEKLFDYFKVYTIKDLANAIETPEPTVSKWKQRSAISPIKKKCKKLGIYDHIFREIDSFSESDFFYTINNTLYNFEIASLISLYFILNKTNINSYDSYCSYNMEKNDIKQNIFNFIKSEFKEFGFNLKNDMFTTRKGRYKLNEDFKYFLSKDKIDYIFENKEQFKESIIFLIEKKRSFTLSWK